jgi:hypothetical protein
MALDEADCNEQSGRWEPPGKETSKDKTKAQLRKKHHRRAGRLACTNTEGCAGILSKARKAKTNPRLTRGAFIHDVSPF